jgi:hypothetical protein
VRAALVLLLIASLAHAEAPADAPVVEERPAMTFKAGEVVPFDGVCMTDGRAVATAKRIASCEAGLAVIESRPSLPVVVALVIGALAVGVLAGTAAGYAAARR